MRGRDWIFFNTPVSVRIVLWVGSVIIGLGLLYYFTARPSFSEGAQTKQVLDAQRLYGHVEKLSVTFAPRNYKRIWNLNKCADYISTHFKAAGAVVSEQTFTVEGECYRNVIAMFGPETESRIVIGSHYDSYSDTPGADDNASGVAGLLEMAYLLGQSELKQQVELVAYTLEEPPFFRSGNMGSARHAYQHRLDGVHVEGMICLEMIGCFSDQKDSQDYPSIILSKLYPDAGNFISIIGSVADHKLASRMKFSMRGATDLPVHMMCAPKGFPMIDFSDHQNYWKHGYSAVMITDTAFLRNKRYHTLEDTVDTLDYQRMSKVVLGVYEAVMAMANDVN